MSTQKEKSTQGGNSNTPADQQACKHILKGILTNFSIGPGLETYSNTLESLLLTYLDSEYIESDDRLARSTVVTVYLDLKRILKGLDTYNKICKFNESNPS